MWLPAAGVDRLGAGARDAGRPSRPWRGPPPDRVLRSVGDPLRPSDSCSWSPSRSSWSPVRDRARPRHRTRARRRRTDRHPVPPNRRRPTSRPPRHRIRSTSYRAPESSPTLDGRTIGRPGCGRRLQPAPTENRDFFAAVAEAVDWTVYCPVLPMTAGSSTPGSTAWPVAAGWRSPTAARADARIDLREGVLVRHGRVRPDRERPRRGRLRRHDRDRCSTSADGRYAVVVDPGATPSWTLIATGLTEADVRSIAADLAPVEG